MKVYKTVSGDYWDKIAYNKLGSEEYTPQLMEANRQYIGYFRFPSGIVLNLPEVDEPVNVSLPPWKRS